MSKKSQGSVTITKTFLHVDVDGEPLSSIVEADETYVGGRRRVKRGRGTEGKTPVIGIVERGGEVKAVVSLDTKRKTIEPLIFANVE